MAVRSSVVHSSHRRQQQYQQDRLEAAEEPERGSTSADAGADDNFDYLRLEQRVVAATAQRAYELPLAAPMGGLASSLASVNFGGIHNVESLNRAYTLFHDLDAIPHDAPKRKSGRRSSIRDSVRTSDASMRDLSEDLSLELAGFDPNVLRAVCSTLLAQGMMHMLDEALLRPKFLDRSDPLHQGEHVVIRWATQQQKGLHIRLNKVAAALPPQIEGQFRGMPRVIKAMADGALQMRAIAATLHLLADLCAAPSAKCHHPRVCLKHSSCPLPPRPPSCPAPHPAHASSPDTGASDRRSYEGSTRTASKPRRPRLPTPCARRCSAGRCAPASRAARSCEPSIRCSTNTTSSCLARSQ